MEMKNKKVYPGLTLVTIEIAKVLKELGWIWATPSILRVRTGEILEPNKYIDCNVGDGFLFLPSICQVIHWLELWGIKITYQLEFTDEGSFYINPEICNEKSEHTKPLYGKEWKSIGEMMLDVIPFALDFLKKIIRENKYEWMLKEGNIAKTKFYSFFDENITTI